jgi:hypothetical protein
MIIAKINPVRVEEVLIQADSDLVEDALLIIWPLVRKHLGNLDRDLRRVMDESLREKAKNAVA